MAPFLYVKYTSGWFKIYLKYKNHTQLLDKRNLKSFSGVYIYKNHVQVPALVSDKNVQNWLTLGFDNILVQIGGVVGNMIDLFGWVIDNMFVLFGWLMNFADNLHLKLWRQCKMTSYETND